MASEFAVSAYQLNADSHTILNGGSQEAPSILDSALDLVTKGVPATLIAAVNEITNIPATVGNLFLNEEDHLKVTSNYDAISNLDSDLSGYYEDHKLGVDTAGFIAAQFLPGMAATKVLRAGQAALTTAVGAGKFGKGFESALGLLAPSKEKYLTAAIKEIGNSGNVFKLTDANMLKAFASGFGQEALEGAAWTAAVNATMYQSPILDGRDASDLAWDVLTGAAVGGVIGGALSGVGSVWRVTKAADAAEAAVTPWTVIGLGGTHERGISTSDRLIQLQRQVDAIPEISPEFQYAERAGREAQRTKQALETEIRKLSGTLSGGDQTVAHTVNKLVTEGHTEATFANLFQSSLVARVTKKTKTESAIAKILSKISDDPLAATDDVVDDLARHRVSYFDVRNGKALANAPAKSALNLADHGDILVKRNAVIAGKLKYTQGAVADFADSKIDQLAAEARYTWTESLKKVPDEIGANDLPMMFRALKEGTGDVNVGGVKFSSTVELADHIKIKQQEIAASLIQSGKSIDEAAQIVNADAGVLGKTIDNPKMWDLRQYTRDTYTQTVGADPLMMPKHIKILSDKVELPNPTIAEGMQHIAQKEKLYAERAARNAAAALGEELPSAAGIQMKAVGTDASGSFVSSTNGNYGTQASFWAYVGQRVSNIVRKKQDALTEQLNPILHRMANNTDAAIEWSVLNEKLRNSVQGWKLSEDGMSLVLREGDDVVDQVAFKNAEVAEMVRLHLGTNARRRSALGQIHAANGLPDRFDPEVFYPIPRDPKDTPFFAFVVDDTVQGRGHSKMIYAKDADTLEAMRNDLMADPALRERGLKVITKKEAEEYYESVGKYEYERTLSDNYINNALARKGKSASFLPLTDPKRIVENTLNWHMQREAGLVRTAVEHRYAKEFDTLRQYGANATSAATSKAGYVNPQAFAEQTVNNPAANMIKLALNISKNDYPVWTPLNRFADAGFSRVYNAMTTAFGKATSPAHLADVQVAMRKHGVEDYINSDALYAATNAKVPRGKLTEVVAKANALLSMLALRTDPFNAMNNAVGHAVLLGPELKHIQKNILAGNEEAVGELAKLMNVRVPGSGNTVVSPAKLVASRISKFGSDKEGREWLKTHGFMSDAIDQQRQALGDISHSLKTGDSTGIDRAFTKIKKLGAGAEKWSGNMLAEEFNRYIAAGTMKDITDIAVRRGLMSQSEQLAYINTFVNRTQGNYIASQRPGLFQGPVGQAIGLFQTYQFNMLQQIFRHVGEGDKKTALMAMGLQGGIYGMNGLPAFNAINTHLIGSAGGNTNHLTGYDAVMSLGGKEAGEWLLYGALSNGLSVFHPDLKSNIYNRGDVNPRNLTLVPLDPSKVPIYQATERLLSNTMEGFKQISMGADISSTFLRGLEQNGISRPLAGLALVLEGAGREDGKVISMSNQGRMVAAHDLWSMQSLMRIAGAKPLDEAIVQDQLFRNNTWRARDVEKRKQLGEAVKKTLAGGNVPDQEQLDTFAYQYAKFGGKQDEYAGWMANAYTQVSVSKAEELRTKLSAPGNQSMQYIMQGYAE